MRIGIITQPLYKNYGGILQNYALQQVLKKMGHTPITLVGLRYTKKEYINTVVATMFGRNRFLKLKDIPKSYKQRMVPKLTWRFVSRNINLSSSRYTHSESGVLNEKLDAIIVGSDQVWRPQYNKAKHKAYLYANFLEHCQNLTIKKVAYAASFGTSEWEFTKEQEERCARLIQQFDAVSVREESGVRLCADHLKRNDAVCVLDPTLLLEKKDYEVLCENIKPLKTQKKRLLAYLLDPTEELLRDLHNLAKKESMALTLVFADDDISFSVEEWLSLFRDADAVITNSYHGTIFSIIFQKPITTIINQDRGADRFNSLFSLLGIQHDNIVAKFPSSPYLKEAVIDIDDAKKRSVDFLNKSLLY